MFSPDISGNPARVLIALTSLMSVLHEKSITAPKARAVMLLIIIPKARYRNIIYYSLNLAVVVSLIQPPTFTLAPAVIERKNASSFDGK